MIFKNQKFKGYRGDTIGQVGKIVKSEHALMSSTSEIWGNSAKNKTKYTMDPGVYF